MIIENKTLIKVEESDYKESFRIPDGIEYIGEKAFYNCKNLKFIYIPESVKEIGVKAFWGCEDLKTLTIPKNVARIGMFALDYCRNMELVTIESKKLLNCVKTTRCIFPNFRRNLFFECIKLKFVILPDSTPENNIVFTCMEKRISQSYKILRESEYHSYVEKYKKRINKGTLSLIKSTEKPNADLNLKENKVVENTKDRN